MEEAKITINGTEITDAMSMTIRVALESFAMTLATDGLGGDEHGKIMTAAYLDRIGEIRSLTA